MSGADPVETVRAYLESAQRARRTRDPDDVADLRRRIADDVEIRVAAPWTDEAFRTVVTSAEQMVERLAAPTNDASRLTTETVNVVEAGSDVLVEQVSTIHRDGRDHVSCVCHVLTLRDGLVAAIRVYRNDLGLPAG